MNEINTVSGGWGKEERKKKRGVGARGEMMFLIIWMAVVVGLPPGFSEVYYGMIVNFELLWLFFPSCVHAVVSHWIVGEEGNVIE